MDAAEISRARPDQIVADVMRARVDIGIRPRLLGGFAGQRSPLLLPSAWRDVRAASAPDDIDRASGNPSASTRRPDLCRNTASAREAVSTKAFQEMASIAQKVRMQPATTRSISRLAQSRSMIASFSIGAKAHSSTISRDCCLSQSFGERHQDIGIDNSGRRRQPLGRDLGQPSGRDLMDTRFACASVRKFAQ